MEAAKNVIEFKNGVTNITISRFLSLKEQIDLLQEQYNDFKESIMQVLEETPHGRLTHGDKSIVITNRNTWEYSDKVHKLERLLKQIKKTEEENGIAKVSKSSKHITVK